MANVPVIISVPHGGEIIAPELTDTALLSQEDIFSDGDPLTRKIYNFRNDVSFYFESAIARAAVDLNRSPEDLPPANPDGVVKSHIVTGKPVYKRNRHPCQDTLRLLLKKYYQPYHERLCRKSRRPGLFCGIDCHTMLDRAPVISDRAGEKRPFICLSNRGNDRGRRIGRQRLTCSPEMLSSFAMALREWFPEEADNITLNDPFSGGYIIRQHSRCLPWIQIELNRRAYLDPRWFDQKTLTVCSERLRELRLKLFGAIQAFVAYNHLPKRGLEEAA